MWGPGAGRGRGECGNFLPNFCLIAKLRCTQEGRGKREEEPTPNPSQEGKREEEPTPNPSQEGKREEGKKYVYLMRIKSAMLRSADTSSLFSVGSCFQILTEYLGLLIPCEILFLKIKKKPCLILIN
ncbi:hypothetical protein LYNGBM3L_37760 [Moorena producens 3L]|uniref:Uncharacterized protein n=1 Tax=Moorena producens 3L TaxID=489825 RepID=F4XQ41_9CYAN|nr:hypothetical protein LYNGBM3L_37760 [Moorena producens 3L]OLT67912.1 hypothetical protein BI334_25370 [Moorena producens 3L]